MESVVFALLVAQAEANSIINTIRIVVFMALLEIKENVTRY